MPSSELQKKAIFFFALVGLATVILLLLPSDDSFRAYVATRMGLLIATDGATLTTADGGNPSMMSETSMSVAVNLLKLLKIILWLTLVVVVVRLLLNLVTKALYRNSSPGEVSSLLQTVISVIIYIVSFFIIFQTQFPTVELAPLFTGSTILGIVVGLALQDTLGNLFSGLAIQADQSFQVGDVLSVGTLGSGVVESVSWRGVKIRTFQNKLLVISNSALGKEAIEVAPKSNLNARLVFFTTVYTASPANVALRIREAVRISENVSQKVRPIVRIKSLGTDGIDWEIKYWLEDYSKYNDSDALVRQRIWYVCQREKIDFAFPTRTIHIEPKTIDVAPEEVVNSITEHLNNVSLFAPLSDEEIERLANASTSRIYAPGEAIVKINQEGNSMFVIIDGSVKVQIPENDYQKTVGTLAENDFFGEMSLLTGEPRSANVIAIVETEVLRIDKNGLKPILEANPTLVEAISELVEERKMILKPGRGEESEDISSPKKGAMKTIRKFFGLK